MPVAALFPALCAFGVFVCVDQNEILRCWRQGLNLIPSRLVKLESSVFHEKPQVNAPHRCLGGIDVMLLALLKGLPSFHPLARHWMGAQRACSKHG